MQSDPAITHISVDAYTVPTDKPESDGTLAWDATTIVIVQAFSDRTRGIGYSYTHASAAMVIQKQLAEAVIGRNAMDVDGAWRAMMSAIRNFGDTGIGAMAVAAVDNALWDLKARLLDIPLATLLGPLRLKVPAYGSGGFTSYTDKQLCSQLAQWVINGFSMVKMKIGRAPEDDVRRVHEARESIGGRTKLFVDANGAYTRKQALQAATRLADSDVRWFEEPVSHRDLPGMQLLRRHAPERIEVTAGEYGFTLDYFQRLLESGAVDVLQADATRCGASVFLRTASLCEAHHTPLSSHTAPSVHLHPCCATNSVRHMEYFHDHAQIEQLFFDGAAIPDGSGYLKPDWSRPGNGLELREKDAQRYLVS